MSLKKIFQDLYPLSPLQEGMLFHRLYNPESDSYLVQLFFTIYADLDQHAFQKSWDYILNQYEVLRTGFLYQDLDRPLQFVLNTVTVPWKILDWSHHQAAEYEKLLHEYLIQDRSIGFDLSKPPLFRLSLIRLSDNSHYFILSIHHILFDGWSVPLLLKSLFDCYAKIIRGEKVELPRARPYKEYIAWLQQQDLNDAEVYWKNVLKGFVSPTCLLKNMSGATRKIDKLPQYVSKVISTETTARIKEFAHKHQLTVNTLLQGVLALILSRYCGEHDIVFGVTVSGRSVDIKDIEKMVGIFINTQPMRIQINSHITAIKFLKDIQQQAADSRQYEYAPLAKIQGWSEIQNSTKLFDIIFIFENYPSEGESFAEGLVKLSAIGGIEKTNYSFAFLAACHDKLLLKITYDDQQFSEEYIENILDSFFTLLQNLIDNSNEHIVNLSALSKREKNKLLIEWNNTKIPFSDNKCIHQLFEQQAEKTPDAIAITYESQKLTYKELNKKANQLGFYLRKIGVKSDSLVALCIERSLELLIGVLGILKAGGAYVPLDPAYPTERLNFMLEDSSAVILLTQMKFHKLFHDYKRSVIRLDADWEKIEKIHDVNISIITKATDLAYVIYTSGTTGKPKGVMIEHMSLCNHMEWMQNTYSFNDKDKFLLKTSISFDASVWEIFMPLLIGAEACFGASRGIERS